jgi:phosphatidylglycerophosphate synthase
MSRSPGTALIYIPPGIEPAAIFTGRPLLDRAFALAQAARLEPLVVDADAPPAPAAGQPARGGLGARPGEALRHADGDLVLLRCDVGCVAGALRDLLASPAAAVVRDDLGRVALVRTTGAALGATIPADLDAAAAALPDLAPGDAKASSARPGWLGGRRILALAYAARDTDPAHAARARERAERELLATLENPRDGFFDGIFNRHLSRPLSRMLLPFSVTPNQITVGALALSLVGAACIALPGIAGPVLGALLLQATAVLDCVDGEIARAKVQESEWGEWLDITSDTLIHVATFLGIAVHAWPQLGRDTAWLLGGLFALGGLASFVVVTRAEKTEDRWKASGTWQARLLATLLATLTTRDTSVLVLVAAATGLLTPLLIGAAFGAQAFWSGTLLLHRSAMRHAS